MMTEVQVSSKSKDNTTVDAKIAIQYQVTKDPGDQESDNTSLWKAVYTLSDVNTTIQGYVEDVVRSILPRMDLDEIFSGKDNINIGVKEQLQEKLAAYGYDISSVLLVHIGIASNVAGSMNEINASARLREAAKEKAEAEKILSVKSAEADAEAKYLLGAGVANQRKAIIEGLKKTVSEFNADVEGTSPRDVMDLLLMTQYFEMVKNVGVGNNTPTTLFLPHGPQSVNDLRAELKNSFKTGGGAK
jgi:regulator of protease activity HflC (stomatin/prohibitin superfamily)